MDEKKLPYLDDTWFKFLVDVELARNYHHADMDSLISGRNPVLEGLLPSLLYVRLVSLLDEKLGEYIQANGLSLPTRKADLNAMVDFLSQQGRLLEASKLHSFRRKRNELAHEAAKSCTWSELEEAMNVVDAELRHLGLAKGARPKLEFYSGRDGPEESTNSRYSMSQRYYFGLKADENPVLEYEWRLNYGGMTDDPEQ